MRRFFLILTTTLSVIAPALAGEPVKDNQSPSLKQCVRECMKERDATAREGCEQQCVLTDAARQKQNPVTPTSVIQK